MIKRKITIYINEDILNDFNDKCYKKKIKKSNAIEILIKKWIKE